MKYANPQTTELKVKHNDIEYKKTIYKPFNSIENVTDENYPNYDPSVTYNTGDYVIVPELKTIYKCAKDNTKGVFPSSDTSVWTEWGFINSYKMLATDEEIGSQTIGKNIVLTMDFNLSDTLGLINTYFAHLTIEQVNNDDKEIKGEILEKIDSRTFKSKYLIYEDSETIYKNGNALTKGDDYTIDYKTHTITLSEDTTDDDEIKADYTKVIRRYDISGKDIACLSFYEYFYTPAKERTRVIETSLEWLPSSFIRLKFKGIEDNDGNITTKIGSIVTGMVEDIGITLEGTQLGFSDKSIISNNPINGYREIKRYGHIKELNAKVAFDIARFNEISERINEVIGKNVLFIPTECDKYTEMINIAYIENAKLPIQNPRMMFGQLTLIGVA